MNTFNQIWHKLARNKAYRKEFVASLLKRGTAMQIDALMKQRKWSQAKLAESSELTQGVISRAANPAYGNLTFNTVIDIAAGFDVAYIGRFVPFSELARWVERMPENIQFEIPGFEQEQAELERRPATNEATIAAQNRASRTSTPETSREGFLFPELTPPLGNVEQSQSSISPPVKASGEGKPFIVFVNQNPRRAAVKAENFERFRWLPKGVTEKRRYRRTTHAR